MALSGRTRQGDDGWMPPSTAVRTRATGALLVAAATVVAAAVLGWAVLVLGSDGVLFAFVVVWAPMAWLGTISRVITPRLPRRWFELRPFERSGRVHELLGARLLKQLLRRGPMAVFNPDLHLPADHDPERLAHLEQRMCDAEAAHALLWFAMLPVAGWLALHGRPATAAWVIVFDAAMNAWPVVLQRYNRALLHQRFGEAAPGTHCPSSPNG